MPVHVDTLHFSTIDAAIVEAVAQPGHAHGSCHVCSTPSLEGAPVAAYKHAMQSPGDTHARVRLGYVFVL